MAQLIGVGRIRECNQKFGTLAQNGLGPKGLHGLRRSLSLFFPPRSTNGDLIVTEQSSKFNLHQLTMSDSHGGYYVCLQLFSRLTAGRFYLHVCHFRGAHLSSIVCPTLHESPTLGVG
jgi:hypothetical protein